MAQDPAFSPAWRQWIRDNLARGCTPESLVAAMVADRFSPDLARQYVSQVAAAAAQPPPATDDTLPPGADAASAPGTGDYRYDAPRLPQDESVIHTPDRSVHISLRLRQPVIAVFDDLLGHDECVELIRQSEAKLRRSTIVDPVTGLEKQIAARSSSGTFFHRDENEFITRLEERIAAAMHWPVENGEGLQILRYGVGGEYQPHYDYFPPADPGSAAHVARGGQRVSTLVIYLNDVAGGGETTFPEVGLEVVPKRGSAVYFEYCNRLGQLDARTLHGGKPVRIGEKWIATKWMRQHRYGAG